MAVHASTQRFKEQIQVSCSLCALYSRVEYKAFTGVSRKDLSDAVSGYIYDELPFALRTFLWGFFVCFFLPHGKVMQVK